MSHRCAPGACYPGAAIVPNYEQPGWDAMADEASRIRQLEDELRAAHRREAEVTGAVAEAGAQQKAAAEILRIISDGPGDLDRVLDRIAEEASRLGGVDDVIIWRTEGGLYWPIAHHGPIALPPDEAAQRARPHSRDSVIGRAVL